jgi:hypothetical protein
VKRTVIASPEFKQAVNHLYGRGTQVNQRPQGNEPKVKATEAGANEQVQTQGSTTRNVAKKTLQSEKDCAC